MTPFEYRHHASLGALLPHMQDPATQRAWDVFLRAVYDEPLDDEQLVTFRECTGRQEPRPGGYPEAVAISGVQSGKTQTAADIIAADAITSIVDLDDDPRAVDGVYSVAAAQDLRGAVRTLFRYASAPFDRLPTLRAHVAGRTSETLTLDNGLTLAAYPCRPSAIRGIRARVCVVDELAFFRTSDNIPTDREMLRVLRGRVATTGGRVIILSSPYAQAGALYDLHRAHYGREDSSTLVWVAPAPAMNPTLAADYLERMAADDPEAYRSEVLGEFRTGSGTFLDPDAIEACVVDRRNLLPAFGLEYFGFVDPSLGKRDAYALCIAHRDRDGERVVIDHVQAWPAPHSPRAVVAEAAVVLSAFRCTSVMGDRAGGENTADDFRAHGIRYELAKPTASQLYLEFGPLVMSTAVELPNDPLLLRELRGLERSRGFAGRDRVDHQRGAHDDLANAVAGAAVMARRAHRNMIEKITGPW